MRRALIVIILGGVLLFGCQQNFSKNSALGQTNLITSNPKMAFPAKAIHVDQKIKVARYRTLEYSVKLELMTHNRFVFLEHAELTDKELAQLTILDTASAAVASNTKVYDLSDHAYYGKYEKFIGRTISIHETADLNYQPTIKKIVLVKDDAYGKSYVALALNLPVGARPIHAFATSNKRLNPFPFIKIEDPQLELLAWMHVDSLSEYQRFKSLNSKANDTASMSYELAIYEVRPNERFVFAQAKVLDQSGQLKTSYCVLFRVTRDNWIQECEGELEYSFYDLIDLDADRYPEIRMIGSGTTAIFEITNKGFTDKRRISWSSDACPC